MQQVIEVKNKLMNANIKATNQKPTHNYIKCPINDTTQIFYVQAFKLSLNTYNIDLKLIFMFQSPQH